MTIILFGTSSSYLLFSLSRHGGNGGRCSLVNGGAPSLVPAHTLLNGSLAME